jgi:SAM-dependent methyltransferase
MALSSDCVFCHEERLAGTYFPSAVPGAGEVRSRLIRRTFTTDVLSGVGALHAGYVLALPRRHVLSCGELSDVERGEFFEVTWDMVDRIRESFGCDVVVVEHGSSGSPRAPSGACIEHAHVHLFPVPLGSPPTDFILDPHRVICGTEELARAASASENYYYCAHDSRIGYLSMNPHVGSQYARRVWARMLGRPHEWDWAVFPEHEEARRTLDILSNRSSPTSAERQARDAAIYETRLCYVRAAETYAERTRYFRADSTLPNELVDLSATSHGVVLDAGSGAGRDAVFLASLGRQVVALDSSRALLAQIPRGSGVTRIQGDLRHIPLRECSIGAIWCSGVLLHLRKAHILECLVEFARVLDPQGVIQISVKEGSGHAVEPMPGAGNLVRHFFYYRAEELIELASRAGLKVRRVWSAQDADSAEVTQTWIKLVLSKQTS